MKLELAGILNQSNQMPVELTEALLSKAAGWDVVKRARAYIEQGQVVSSYWAPPLLRGVVETGESSYRASLVIENEIDIENLCNCRESREWGKICAHVVAVGLHWLQAKKGEAAPVGATSKTAGGAKTPVTGKNPSPALPARKISALQREAAGEPAELHLVLPPNVEQAIARGKMMLVFEAKWSGGRVPLNALPKGRAYAFSAQDDAVIESVETLTNGETPAMMQMDAKDFAALLPALAGHENITIGKSKPVTVTKTPLQLPIRATLEANGEITVAMREKAAAAAFTIIGDWAWRDGTFQPLGLPATMKDVLRAPIKITRAEVPSFLSQQWPQLSAMGVEANFKLEDFSLAPQAPKFLLSLKGGSTQLSALLQCAYGARIMTPGVTSADENVWLPDPESPTRYSTRDFTAERGAVARLQRSGFLNPDAQGRMQMSGQNSVLNFLAREFPKLQREWSVTLDEQLENRTLKEHRARGAAVPNHVVGRAMVRSGRGVCVHRRRDLFGGGNPAAAALGPEPYAIEERQDGGDRHGRGGGIAGGAAGLRATAECATRRARVSHPKHTGRFSGGDVAAEHGLEGAGAVGLA